MFWADPVAVLDNGIRNSGMHSVMFDGGKISSGIYYYRLKADGFEQVCKMLLMK